MTGRLPPLSAQGALKRSLSRRQPPSSGETVQLKVVRSTVPPALRESTAPVTDHRSATPSFACSGPKTAESGARAVQQTEPGIARDTGNL